jgi:hypothetical protein
VIIYKTILHLPDLLSCVCAFYKSVSRLRRKVIGICVIIAMFTVSVNVNLHSTPVAEAPASLLKFREFLLCGPNSLFVFLILSGHPNVTLEELNITITKDGSSLLDLRDAAKKIGVDTEIRHYRPEQIDLVPLPAIGYFRTPGFSTLPRHFDVIYKVDSKWTYLINGTTGNKFKMLRSRLSYYWEGSVLIEKQSFARLAMNQCFLPLLAIATLIADFRILGLKFHRPQFFKKHKDISKMEVSS